MHQILFTLTGTPVGKERPKVGRGRAYTPRKTKVFEQSVAWTAKQALLSAGISAPISEPVRVYLVVSFTPPAKVRKTQAEQLSKLGYVPCRTPDCDNLAKSVLDAMNDVVYCDDRQVYELSVLKRYSDCEKIDVLVEWGMAKAV